MKIRLAVVAGPNEGREFAFDGRDTFLVGRTPDCHLPLSYDDPYVAHPDAAKAYKIESGDVVRLTNDDVLIPTIGFKRKWVAM